MKIEKFEDIISWQKSKELTVKLYKLFEGSNDFAFKNQILRASLSIMNNIAEGFERNSNKEFKYFLFIAKGSCGEVRSMLHLALELNKLDDVSYNKLYLISTEISKLISGFIKKL
jgi:four helix bundle protein